MAPSSAGTGGASPAARPSGDGGRFTGALPAAVVAGVLSGLPSTVHGLATGRSPRAAVEAAGALVGRPTVPAGALVHAALSLGWATVLARLLPRRAPVAAGATVGLLIAALDLGVVGRRIPAVRALPLGPQVADHVAFGVLAAAVVAAARRRQRRVPPTKGRPARDG